MIRTCAPTDEFIGLGDQRCGLEFDDAERSTICPHDLLWPQFDNPISLIIWIITLDHVFNEYAKEKGWNVERPVA